MSSIKELSSPIEVWLSKANLEVSCRVIFEDETAEELDVDSLSMRGAQREITSWLIDRGYDPLGRWKTEAADRNNDAVETSRNFKLAKGEK